MSRALPAETASGGSLLLTYRVIVTLFAALVVVQAFLGTRGAFADPDLTSVHEIVANVMFLLVVVQTALAWVLSSRGAFTMRPVLLNVVLVLLTVGQTGLGYITRNVDNYATAVSLHIPNGVLMMGIAAVVVTAAWQTRPDRRAA